MSGCDQFIVHKIHGRGGTHNLLITEVYGLVLVAVVSTIGNSDHSSLSAVISMAQVIPNFCVKGNNFFKPS